VHVAALWDPPATDIDVSDLARGFGLLTYTPGDLIGSSEIGFSMIVPSNTTLYLWAFVDVEPDGVVREGGEPVAAADDAVDGVVFTGITDDAGRVLVLAIP